MVLDGKPCPACTEDIKLEQDIRDLEQMIEKSHNRRRALRTVMNENHDHLIHKFPPEIASHIFIQCAPLSVSRYEEDRNTPLLLGSVCRRWRQLAWATPQLGSSIIVGPRKVPLELIAEWLERSASLPLTIQFFGYSGQHDEVSQILNKHSARWYDIHLDIPPTSFPFFDGSSQENILHRLVLRCFSSPMIHDSDSPKFSMKSQPRPTNLTLLRLALPYVDIIWTNLTVASVFWVGDCVELIRRAPLLRTLRMRDIHSHASSFPLPNIRIVHHHLHSLELSEMYNQDAAIGFLDSVCFPSLEQWIYRHHVFFVEHMISFIEWSPRLKVLKISIDNIPVHQLTQLLGRLSLEHLELHSSVGAGYHQIIEMLCASGESPLFLPHMQSLECICEASGSFPCDSLPQICVSSRWRSLRVKVNVFDGWGDITDESAKLLRELIDKGFDLSIVDEMDALQEDKWYY